MHTPSHARLSPTFGALASISNFAKNNALFMFFKNALLFHALCANYAAQSRQMREHEQVLEQVFEQVQEQVKAALD